MTGTRRSPPAPAFWMLFGGSGLVLGLMFFGVGAWFAIEERRYEAEGRIAEGLVLAKERRATARERSYLVRLRFTAADGEVVEGEARVSEATWRRLAERRPVEVVYLPARPSSHRIRGEYAWTAALVFLILGVVFAVLGGSVLVRAMPRAPRATTPESRVRR